jgi:hypothetical protein
MGRLGGQKTERVCWIVSENDNPAQIIMGCDQSRERGTILSLCSSASKRWQWARWFWSCWERAIERESEKATIVCGIGSGDVHVQHGRQFGFTCSKPFRGHMLARRLAR